MKPRKLCKSPGCARPAFSHEYCDRRGHQLLRSDSSFVRAEERREAKKKEPKKPVNKVSAKQKVRNDLYSSELPGWREENPRCCYPDCWKPTEHCHHVIGRGIHTNNKKYMLPMCSEHHDICKMNPKLAVELRLIETRTINRKHEY